MFVVESDSLHEDVREGRLPQPEGKRAETDKDENVASPANSNCWGIIVMVDCDHTLISYSTDFQGLGCTHS